MVKLILGIQIFIFVLACLNVLNNAFKFFKVLWVKQGKFELTKTALLLFGCSISYIITQLIIGF